MDPKEREQKERELKEKGGNVDFKVGEEKYKADIGKGDLGKG